MLKLLLLTAQRREKVASMKSSDVADGVWTIASEEREKGNAGVLKLPQLALDIIAAQPRIAGNPYVFGYRHGKWFTGWSHYKAQLDAKLKELPHWTVHDLRRTARSLMSRAGVYPDHAERCLGHVVTGVRGVYDRHQFHHEKEQAFEALAGLIERIVNPPEENVIALQR